MIPIDVLAAEDGVTSPSVELFVALLVARGYAAPTKKQLVEWHEAPKAEKLNLLREWTIGFDLVVFFVNGHGFVIPSRQEPIVCLKDYWEAQLDDTTMLLSEFRAYEDVHPHRVHELSHFVC